MNKHNKHLEVKDGVIFPRGDANEAYARYFTGSSYLSMLTAEEVFISTVTFEPGCRNFWHAHVGSGQTLLVTGGLGWYQEWGRPAKELKAGDVVNIPEGVKHWHGAAKDSWFVHLAISVPGPGSGTDWQEEVNQEDYEKLASCRSPE